MAEFEGLDATLRDTLARTARPADPTGVADALRARVAAGDPGIPVTTTTAPGWGGGVWSWLPWVGLVALGAAGGLGVGATGVLGAESRTETVVERTAVLDGTAPAASCPAGPVVDTLAAGTRVLVIERSADTGHVGIRDPHDFASVLWLPAGDLIVDAGQPALAELPVGSACPEVILTAPVPVAPAPEDPDEPAPGPDPNPPPVPGDTQAPALQQWGATPNPVYNLDPVTVTTLAADDVGVVGVDIAWSGEFAGSGSMTLVGSQWRFVFTPPDDDGGLITFTLRARDAAGNLSAPVHVAVDHQYFG